jgi:hypothetical protein
MYVAAPMEEFKATQKELQGRYQAAAAQDDKLLAEMANLQSSPFENDKQMLQQLKDHYSGRLNERVQRGDYESMGRETIKDAISFVKDYAPIKRNADTYNQYTTTLKERLNKGEITKDRYDAALFMSQYGYAGVDPDNVEGTLFKGYQPLKHVDIGGELMKEINDWKANSSESPYHFDGKMFWTKDKTKYVDAGEVQRALYARVSANPEFMAYINESVRINTFGKSYSEQDVSGLRGSMLQRAKTAAEKQAIQNLTPAQLVAHTQRESIIQDYINPAAEKASFVEHSSESMMDPGVKAAMAQRAKREEQAVFDRQMTTFDSNYTENPAMKDFDMFKDVKFDETTGKLVDHGGNASVDPEEKSKQWEAKLNLANYKTQFMQGSKAQMDSHDKNSAEYKQANATYQKFKNMPDKEWAQHVNNEFAKRRLSNTYELKFTNPKVLNYYQKQIVGQRDFSGRALHVAGMEGVVTMDQLIDELGIDPKKQKAFYDTMKITGVNLMAGSDEENQKLAGGLKFTATDPETGKTYSGVIQNNNEIASKVNPYARGSMFAMTNTNIGYPLPPTAKNLTPAQQEEFYKDHVLPDPEGQPGHRVIAYNGVNSRGEMVPMFRRQGQNTTTGKWVDVPDPIDMRKWQTNKSHYVKPQEYTYEDYRRKSKEDLEVMLGNDVFYKSSTLYDDNSDQDLGDD